MERTQTINLKRKIEDSEGSEPSLASPLHPERRDDKDPLITAINKKVSNFIPTPLVHLLFDRKSLILNFRPEFSDYTVDHDKLKMGNYVTGEV